MKCIGCGYFNMPQALTCGQCGMDLARPSVRAGGSLGQSLYPPRARDLTFLDRVQQRIRPLAPPARTTSPALALSLRPWLVMTAALLPGAGHLLLRDTRGGLRLMAVFLAMLGLALLLLHSWVSDLLLWSALGTVYFSVWETANRSFPPAPASPEAQYLRSLRLGFLSIGTVAGTLGSLYWMAGQWYPLYHLATNVSAPGLQAGDEVVEQRLARPLADLRRGDIVLAQSNDYPIIERVLGLPGDQVNFAGGALWVNGRRVGPGGLPLSAAALQPVAGTFGAVVPPGQVCLWRVPAGYYPEAGEGGGTAPAASFATLNAKDIEGRLLGVLEPPARRRWFRRPLPGPNRD